MDPMDRLTLLFDPVQQWLITPLWHCFTGLLDFNGRLGAPFLLVSGTVAYLLYRHRRRQGDPGARSFAGFLGGGPSGCTPRLCSTTNTIWCGRCSMWP